MFSKLENPKFAYAVVGLLAVVILYPYKSQLNLGLNDAGVVMQAAKRMAAGDIPYRDFDMFYTPGSMTITAIWMKIFGQSFNSLGWLTILNGTALTLGVYALSRRIIQNSLLALLAPVLFLISGFGEWPLLSYHWFALTCFVWCLVLVSTWSKSRTPKMLVLTGVAVGLAGACLQSEGAASGIGSYAVILLVFLETKNWRELVKNTGYLIAGVGIVWVPLIGLLIATGSFSSFVDNTIIAALSGLYRAHAAPYDFHKHAVEPWAALSAGWPADWNFARLRWAVESASMVWVWTFKYALLFPIAVLAGLLSFRRGLEPRALAIFLFLLILVKRERLDLLYSNYLTPLWYVALAYCLWELAQRSRLAAKVIIGCCLIPYSVVLISTWSFHSGHIYRVETLAGSLWSRDPAGAFALQNEIVEATALVPPGSSTFAWPFRPSFYLLTDTKNPTRLDFLVPGWQTLEQASEVSRQLKDSNVNTVFYSNLDPTLVRDYPNLDPAKFQEDLQKQKAVVTENFRLLKAVGGTEIWVRNEELSNSRRTVHPKIPVRNVAQGY